MAALYGQSSALAWLGDVPAESSAPHTSVTLPATRSLALVPVQNATPAPSCAPATSLAPPPMSSSGLMPMQNACPLARCLGPWRLQWMEGEIQEGQSRTSF